MLFEKELELKKTTGSVNLSEDTILIRIPERLKFVVVMMKVPLKEEKIGCKIGIEQRIFETKNLKGKHCYV